MTPRCATATSTAASRHRHAVLVLLPADGRLPGPLLPAHHARPRQREPRADRSRTGGQDRLRRSQRRLLRRDQRRRPGGQPGSGVDPTIARLPRQRGGGAVTRASSPRQMYGEHRPYGYAYGGSGGGYRTIGGAENTDGVWDGVRAVRHRQSRWRSRTSSPCACTPSACCATVLDTIVDALEPGGSGDPYAGLDAEERAALAEVTRMGFPPRVLVRPPHHGHARLHRALRAACAMATRATSRTSGPCPATSGADPGVLGPPRPRPAQLPTIAARDHAREAARLGLHVTARRRKAGTASTTPSGERARTRTPSSPLRLAGTRRPRRRRARS